MRDNTKWLLYPADGDIDEDDGMTKEQLMRLLAEELDFRVEKKNDPRRCNKSESKKSSR